MPLKSSYTHSLTCYVSGSFLYFLSHVPACRHCQSDLSLLGIGIITGAAWPVPASQGHTGLIKSGLWLHGCHHRYIAPHPHAILHCIKSGFLLPHPLPIHSQKRFLSLLPFTHSMRHIHIRTQLTPPTSNLHTRNPPPPPPPNDTYTDTVGTYTLNLPQVPLQEMEIENKEGKSI
jgi:hypothetical protein